MSMPDFSKCKSNISKEQALNMILTSIAMEELGLSHIINAEGEKLQYVLGTLKNKNEICANTDEILQVNESVNNLLDKVMQSQIILKGKMERVLNKYPNEHLCNNLNVRQAKSNLILTNFYPEYCWEKNCLFSWNCSSQLGRGIQWDKNEPCVIRLFPCKKYCGNFSITIHKKSCLSDIKILLQIIKDNCFETLCPYYFSIKELNNCSVILSGTIFIDNQTKSCKTFNIGLMLSCPNDLCVQQAILNIYEYKD